MNMSDVETRSSMYCQVSYRDQRSEPTLEHVARGAWHWHVQGVAPKDPSLGFYFYFLSRVCSRYRATF